MNTIINRNGSWKLDLWKRSWVHRKEEAAAGSSYSRNTQQQWKTLRTGGVQGPPRIHPSHSSFTQTPLHSHSPSASPSSRKYLRTRRFCRLSLPVRTLERNHEMRMQTSNRCRSLHAMLRRSYQLLSTDGRRQAPSVPHHRADDSRRPEGPHGVVRGSREPLNSREATSSST